MYESKGLSTNNAWLNAFAENQVGCSELPVYVHKNLRPKDEVEISHMYNSKIWLKPSSFCNKPTKD